MSFTLTRSAAGLALLTALLAGCGASATSQPAGGQSSTPTTASTPAASTPAAPSPSPAPAKSTVSSNGIPQGNAGDQDADNNGGPSDGDGNI